MNSSSTIAATGFRRRSPPIAPPRSDSSRPAETHLRGPDAAPRQHLRRPCRVLLTAKEPDGAAVPRRMLVEVVDPHGPFVELGR